MQKTIKHYYLAPLVIFFAILALLLFFNYRDEQKNAFSENTSYNKLFANTVQSNLHELELTLNNLGYRLLEKNNIDDTEKIKGIAEKTMSRNLQLLGISLLRVDGEAIVFFNGRWSNAADIPTIGDAQGSFDEVFTAQNMIVGDTYYSEIFHEWIMPFHKAFRNQDGEVMGVISVVTSLDKTLGQWGHEKLDPHQRSVVTKDDGTTVYSNALRPEEYNSVFGVDQPKDFLDYHLTKMAKSVGLTKSHDLRQLSSSFEYHTIHPRTQEPCYFSLKYNKTYELWILTYLPLSAVHVSFLEKTLHRLPFIISFFAVFFYLLVKIYKKERESSKELRHQASHDSLTNLYSRSALSAIFSKWIKDSPDSFYLLHLNLDNFKLTNDNFGHSFGDKVLIEVSNRLNAIKPESCDIVRYAGDEFSLFLKSSPGAPINDACQSLINALSEPYTIANLTAYIGCSIGISQYPDNGESHEDLITTADIALQKAKNKKNCYMFFSKQMQEEVTRKSLLERNLRLAISKGELFMMFQPQVRSNGTVFGAEALIRWIHPEIGFIPPDEFIKVAESAGLMPELGKFIIERSCQDFAEVKAELGEISDGLTLSINISVQQLFEKEFQQDLFNTLLAHNIKKEDIILEITESIFIDELDYTLPLLESTRHSGINISLDDFGTGYSSLSMLRSLPLDELKIDKAFIDNINTESQDSEMVRSIISMGQIMGLSIVAEGVEDSAQVELLTSLNCTIFQGYFFSQPLKKEDLIILIKERGVTPHQTKT